MAESDFDYYDEPWLYHYDVPCARCGQPIEYGRHERVVPGAVCDNCFSLAQDTQRRKAEQETRQRRKGTAA